MVLRVKECLYHCPEDKGDNYVPWMKEMVSTMV